MYRNEARVRYSELGADGKMTMAGILDCFQDSCIFQAEDNNVGTQFQKERGIVWILLTWQIEVKRYPSLGERITVGTFPYAFKGPFGYRNFIMESSDGEQLACGDSLWMLVERDLTSKATIPEEMVIAYQLESKLSMNYDHKKIVLPGNAVEEESFTIKKFHLDTNFHVNNGQYVHMMSDYLPKNEVITNMKVEYRKQAVMGDMIKPIVGRDGNQVVISLCSEDSSPYAIGRFTVDGVR